MFKSAVDAIFKIGILGCVYVASKSVWDSFSRDGRKVSRLEEKLEKYAEALEELQESIKELKKDRRDLRRRRRKAGKDEVSAIDGQLTNNKSELKEAEKLCKEVWRKARKKCKRAGLGINKKQLVEQYA